MSLETTTVALRLWGNDLDPYAVTALLGCAPSRARRKGDVRRSRVTGQDYVAKTGSWQLMAPDRADGDLDRQAAEVLGKVTSDLSVWRILNERYRCDLFCGFFMGSGNDMVRLSAATSRMVGARGLELVFDIYDAVES
ncbi:DUF4279 domain-containing protein [Pontivivens ytuae]|uniref:DUF4279 domain-containing protein n=1 Tax=Pontivivens ytuae TaxID=2789856 RepID=A0A7S9LTL3_9RHOB|nr:DUF4279 domain-containing protein [Pontivivens ytuae]QPH54904.1 DUF4279 domain-containing protein [Pontivivens ytuae]